MILLIFCNFGAWRCGGCKMDVANGGGKVLRRTGVGEDNVNNGDNFFGEGDAACRRYANL